MRDTPTLALALAGLLLALAINVLALPTTNLVASLYAVPVLVAAIRLRPRVVAIISALAILFYVASAQIQGWPVAQQVLAFPALLAIACLAILLSRQRGQTVERAREA